VWLARYHILKNPNGIYGRLTNEVYDKRYSHLAIHWRWHIGNSPMRNADMAKEMTLVSWGGAYQGKKSRQDKA